MIGYYAYLIDNDGHITRRDEEAKRRAKQLVDGYAVELWQQARKIKRFEREE